MIDGIKNGMLYVFVSPCSDDDILPIASSHGLILFMMTTSFHLRLSILSADFFAILSFVFSKLIAFIYQTDGSDIKIL